MLTFKGGIHPFEGKELSKDKEIQKYNPTSDVAISMSQHIGAPATPVVKVGDEVKVGQLIGEASGFISANVHSSVSGKVKAIEKRLLVSGSKATCIVIANDGKNEKVVFPKPRDYKKLSKEEIIGFVKEAGVVGMGGAGFPTNVKLSPKEPDKIDYMVWEEQVFQQM